MFLARNLLNLHVVPTGWAAGPYFLAAEQQPTNPWGMFIWFAPVLVLYIVMLAVLPARQRRKEAEQRLQKFRTMQKNDAVVTASGIFGKFISISEDGQEVTIRVDENTRLRLRPDVVYPDQRAAAAAAKSNTASSGRT